MNILPPQNLAPKKPLFELADTQNPTPTFIQAGLQELFNDILKRDEATFREIAETTEITSNFIQGKQLFQQTTNGWRIQNIRRVNPNRISAINMMQFYCTQNLQRIASSNPDIEPADVFRRVEYKDKIKKAKAVWNDYERKFYTPWIQHQKALHLIISGTCIQSVQYDHLAKGSQVFKEIWGEKPLPIVDGGGTCFSCEFEGDYDSFAGQGMPQCPECGSYEVDLRSPVSKIVPAVIGMQPIQTGDLTLKLIPIQSCRFDVKGQAELSPYFLERTRMPVRRLGHILGTKLNIGETDMGEDKGLRSLNAIQTAGNTLFGQDTGSTDTSSKDTIVDRLSLSPEEYAHIIARKEEETLSGGKIPAGAKLIDLCPNGMTVIGVNNFKHILGIYPDVHHSKEIASGVFHSRLASGVGRGSEDAVEVQKRFNRNDAQMVKAGEIGATPAHYFVEGSVDRRHVKQIGKPDTAIPIKREVAEALGKADLIGQLPVGNIAGTFFQYTYDILNKYRQLTSHAPDYGNGMSEATGSSTATAARISDANAEATYGPILEMNAQSQCRIAHLTLDLYSQHFQGVSKWFSFGTTKQDISVGEQIKGEDLDCDIEFVVVKDSQRPKTRYNQQNALEAVFTMAGGAAGLVQLKMEDQQLYDGLLKTFDLDLGENAYDTVEDLCFRRVQQACQAMQSGVSDPTEVLMALKPLITPYEPYHKEKMEWLAEYLDSPEGVEMSEDERRGIFVLMEAHKNGGVYQAGEMLAAQNSAMAMGQQPLIDQQMQQQQDELGIQAQQMAMDQQAGEQKLQQQLQGQAIQAGGQAIKSEIANEQHGVQMAQNEESAQQQMALKEAQHQQHMSHQTDKKAFQKKHESKGKDKKS